MSMKGLVGEDFNLNEDGIIGADFLRLFGVTLDFRNNVISLFNMKPKINTALTLKVNFLTETHKYWKYWNYPAKQKCMERTVIECIRTVQV